jgi:hypothetical protein
MKGKQFFPERLVSFLLKSRIWNFSTSFGAMTGSAGQNQDSKIVGISGPTGSHSAGSSSAIL